MFLLVSRGRLPAPLLYRRAYLERDRRRYYAGPVRAGDRRRVPWIEMFFIAVKIQASDAMSRAERTIELRERYRGMAAAMETATGWRWSTRCARTRW